MGAEPQSLVASSPGSLRPLPTGLAGLGAERATASGLASPRRDRMGGSGSALKLRAGGS